MKKKAISDILWELIPHENKFVITEKDILDYITNLQQELQRKDKIINSLKKWLSEDNIYNTNDKVLDKLKELENDI